MIYWQNIVDLEYSDIVSIATLIFNFTLSHLYIFIYHMHRIQLLYLNIVLYDLGKVMTIYSIVLTAFLSGQHDIFQKFPKTSIHIDLHDVFCETIILDTHVTSIRPI